MNPDLRLARAKMWGSILGLLLISVVCFWGADSLPASTTSHWHWLKRVPLASLGSTVLGVALIGIAYEWILRKDLEAATLRNLTRHLKEFRRELLPDLVAAVLTDDENLKNAFSTRAGDRITLAALTAHLGDGALAADALSSISATTAERWMNYRHKLTLLPAPGLPGFFDAYSEVDFTTNVDRSEFWFAVVGTKPEYEELRKDPRWDYIWIFPEIPGFTALDEEVFELTRVSRNGTELAFDRIDHEGHKAFRAAAANFCAGDGQWCLVKYAFRVLIAKSPQSLQLRLPHLTRDPRYEIDASRADVYWVNAFDFFATKRAAIPTTGPAFEKGVTSLTVEVPGWVLPQSGVVFSWVPNSDRPKPHD